jgi:streptomycin 6-kinase
VRLLEADRARRALLVERCLPGTPLWQVADEQAANDAAAAVLQRLWRPPPERHAVRALEDEARRWAAELPGRWERHGRPFERALLDRAVAWIGELLATPDDAPVVVHQDLHGGNVLRATREPSPSTPQPRLSTLRRRPGGIWLAIDPKPLVGDRAFDVASLLRDRRGELAADPHPVRRLRRRLDQVSTVLELDRERMRGWAVVHALAWGMDDYERFDDILASAVWLDRA